MRTAAARGRVVLPPAEALALWADIDRWASFVEGFARVISRSPDWPAEHARIVWESRPDGRGRVTETVLVNSPDRFATQVFESALMGEQTLHAAAAEDGGSAVVVTLDYDLVKYGPLRGAADALFIRRALRDSLRRTLTRFAIEAEEEAGVR